MSTPTSPTAAPPAGRTPMKFSVDSWDPSYGSSVDGAETAPTGAETTVKVNAEVERAAADWKPIPVTPAPEPGAILFVDGVRRIEARIWIEQPPVVDTTTGEIAYDADSVMALCASYAAGTVCCCPDSGAHLLTAETRRGLFTTASNATSVATTAGTYAVTTTPDDPGTNLAVLLSAALQRKLADLEVVVANEARAALIGHGVPADTDLMVIDGPLRGRTHLARALGYIKSHRTTYLPPELNRVVANLAPGQRTPVFLMGTSWDRHAWYLRLPCRPGSPWAGIVRVECSPSLSTADVVALADQSQTVLPKYASVEYKDTRAPQNLVPVAGLERELRRRLGDNRLLTRALMTAAARG